MFLCHGLGDHSGRYDCIVKELVQKGCYVFTHDHGEKLSRVQLSQLEYGRGDQAVGYSS